MKYQESNRRRIIINQNQNALRKDLMADLLRYGHPGSSRKDETDDERDFSAHG